MASCGFRDTFQLQMRLKRDKGDPVDLRETRLGPSLFAAATSRSMNTTDGCRKRMQGRAIFDHQCSVAEQKARAPLHTGMLGHNQW